MPVLVVAEVGPDSPNEALRSITWRRAELEASGVFTPEASPQLSEVR